MNLVLYCDACVLYAGLRDNVVLLGLGPLFLVPCEMPSTYFSLIIYFISLIHCFFFVFLVLFIFINFIYPLFVLSSIHLSLFHLLFIFTMFGFSFWRSNVCIFNGVLLPYAEFLIPLIFVSSTFCLFHVICFHIPSFCILITLYNYLFCPFSGFISLIGGRESQGFCPS